MRISVRCSSLKSFIPSSSRGERRSTGHGAQGHCRELATSSRCAVPYSAYPHLSLCQPFVSLRRDRSLREDAAMQRRKRQLLENLGNQGIRVEHRSSGASGSNTEADLPDILGRSRTLASGGVTQCCAVSPRRCRNSVCTLGFPSSPAGLSHNPIRYVDTLRRVESPNPCNTSREQYVHLGMGCTLPIAQLWKKPYGPVAVIDNCQ